MSKLLYITAHPHDHSTSYSLAVGKAFLDSYKENHPQDEIVHIDLYRENIPQLDADIFSGWGQLQSGAEFASLSSDQQAKIGRLGVIVDQFVSGDKYVFVSPMWNFSFPPILKAYIDAICVAGKTFRYTENGPVGLLQGKKALHVQASGGFYSQGPAAALENGYSYLSKVLGFLGIIDTQNIFVEGMAFTPDKAGEIKAAAIDKAVSVAKTF